MMTVAMDDPATLSDLLASLECPCVILAALTAKGFTTLSSIAWAVPPSLMTFVVAAVPASGPKFASAYCDARVGGGTPLAPLLSLAGVCHPSAPSPSASPAVPPPRRLPSSLRTSFASSSSPTILESSSCLPQPHLVSFLPVCARRCQGHRYGAHEADALKRWFFRDRICLLCCSLVLVRRLRHSPA